MSPLSPRGLTIHQWGHEGLTSSLQSAVAATSQIACEELTMTPIDTIVRPNVFRGVNLAVPGFETVATRGMNWTMNGPLSFSQAQVLLGMAILYDAAPTGGSAPYTWTHTYTPTSALSVATRTFERRITDASNADDDEWPNCVLNELELSWQLDGLVMFRASGFGRARADSTLTAAQTLPTPVYLPSPTSKLWIDSTWANLGTTAVAGQLLSWRFMFRNGAAPRYTADARTNLDFGVVVPGPASLEFEATVLVDTNSAQYSIEQTAAEAATLRAPELVIDGGSNETLTLDFLAKHTAGSLYELTEEDGMNVVSLQMQGSTDGTNFCSAVLTNAVGTLV